MDNPELVKFQKKDEDDDADDNGAYRELVWDIGLTYLCLSATTPAVACATVGGI